MKELVIFDLDGTLLNTISDLGNACNHALREKGIPHHSLSSYNYMVGNGVGNLIKRAAPEASEEELEDLMKLFRQYYNQHCTDLTKPYPGIENLLSELNSRGIKLAVSSNKYQSAVEKIIGHFFPLIPFVAVYGEREGIPRKPDPSIVFSILGENPTPKRNVLLVGDSAVDIETARRACVESVGVTWGFRPVSELRRAYADHIVSHPEEIISLLSSEY